jgi:hypothetical protein
VCSTPVYDALLHPVLRLFWKVEEVIMNRMPGTMCNSTGFAVGIRQKGLGPKDNQKMCVPKIFVGFWVRLLRRIGKRNCSCGCKNRNNIEKVKSYENIFSKLLNN